jgi:hypothetical protein
MAFLESAVVIYIREIYYPEGFGFPLQPMETALVLTEVIREAATVVMILSVALLASGKRPEIFANFLVIFGVWDIFYYLFLKMLVGWPATLQTWDILFFIPVMWVGPVWAPVVNSLMMIALGTALLYFSPNGKTARFNRHEWALLILGAVLVFTSYTESFTGYLLEHFSAGEWLGPGNHDRIMDLSTRFVPDSFQWIPYLAGCLMHITVLFLFTARNILYLRHAK